MPRFVCLDDDVPPETISLLQRAAEARGISFAAVNAAAFDYLGEGQLQPGDMLYNPATSPRAEMAERHLFGPGVIGLRSDPMGPFSMVGGGPLLFERCGLPVPPGLALGAVTPDYLASVVEELGGFPVVVKAPGGSGGIGVMRAESMESLIGLVEYLLAKGVMPWLSAHVADATCWRVVVVGGRAVGCCRNPAGPRDFRSTQSDDPKDYAAEVPGALAALAVKATALLRLELGGADILEDAAGRLYLLEVNFPCYFAHLDMIGGLDVAGAIVDHMLSKRG